MDVRGYDRYGDPSFPMVALAAMWKSYLTFFRAALEAQFPSAWYRRPLKALWSASSFVLFFVIGTYLGVPLKDVAEPAYRLLPAPLWAAIALAIMVASLLLIINGARRVQERTVNAAYEASEALAAEQAASMAKVEIFTLFKGRFDGLYLLLDNRRWPGSKGAPLLAEEIRWHEADFSNKLLDWFGDDYRTTYFKQLGDIPETVLDQSERLRSHSNPMHQQIQRELARQRAITERAGEEQRATLMKAQAAAREV